MLKINKKFNILLSSLYSIFIISLIIIPQKLLARADYGEQEAAQTAGLFPSGGAEQIPVFLGRFAGGALALSGSIFLFLIVYGGIIIMTAAGSPDKVKKGKDIIIWAIIGALILGSAYAITSLVFQAFQ